MTIGAKGSVGIRVREDVQVNNTRAVRTIINSASDSVARVSKNASMEISHIRDRKQVEPQNQIDRKISAELEGVVDGSVYRGSELSSNSRGNVIGLHSIFAFVSMNQTIYQGDAGKVLEESREIEKENDEEEISASQTIANASDASDLEYEGIIFSDAKGPAGVTRPAFDSTIVLMDMKPTTQTKKFMSNAKETARREFGYDALTAKDDRILNLNTDSITIAGFLNIMNSVFEDVPEMGSAEVMTEELSHDSHKIALGAMALRPAEEVIGE